MINNKYKIIDIKETIFGEYYTIINSEGKELELSLKQFIEFQDSLEPINTNVNSINVVCDIPECRYDSTNPINVIN